MQTMEFYEDATIATTKIWLLTALATLNRLERSFNVIVLPLLALALGANEAFYGLMVASAGYVQSFILFPAGTLSDHRGRGITIFIGGIISGFSYFLIPFQRDLFIVLVLYATTGIGNGFTSTSIRTMIADYTKRGEERTRSYGITDSIAVFAAMLGPFLAGYVLDAKAFPGISDEMLRFAFLLMLIGATKIVTAILGIFTENWLQQNKHYKFAKEVSSLVQKESPEQFPEERDRITTLLFGASQLIMGISSGMVIPYLVPWINAAFTPDPFLLGLVPSVSSITLALGTLFVGFMSERTGKLRMIFLLYLFAPFLTIGLVYTPLFSVMIVFYVAREAVANMTRPASTSLFMSEISTSRRARSFAATRIMWTFPRQTGTLITSFILSLGLFENIVVMGRLFFPLAVMMYPISVIPMWIAVKRNRAKYRDIT